MIPRQNPAPNIFASRSRQDGLQVGKRNGFGFSAPQPGEGEDRVEPENNTEAVTHASPCRGVTEMLN